MESKYFRPDFTSGELSDWVNDFAIRFSSDTFSDNAVKIARNLLKEQFGKEAISVCLEMNSVDEIPIKIAATHTVSLEQMEKDLISQRKKFDKMLRTHPDLKFMKGGEAG